jgi:hypothetical protein
MHPPLSGNGLAGIGRQRDAEAEPGLLIYLPVPGLGPSVFALVRIVTYRNSTAGVRLQFASESMERQLDC